ncbi:PmoA family protein [Prolixibacteraceae bacterium Z1-6]|uniref:PmoA family protein n=1 Tax=Draconibacterium aestuarii TaxID=2998507 RepID=A0A9X3J505_9BACT|nr:PmoA family protein [Prolixibacteraceae bacterium Z1-6]
MKKTEGGIKIVDGNKNVLAYRTTPKSLDGKYERCNYIHPLWGPDGKVLTEDFPADHLHHRGVFWAWHQVWIGDKRIGDPWELVDFEQDVVELEFMKSSDGAVQLKTEVEWKSGKWKVDGKKVPYMKEFATITVNKAVDNYRKIDFEIKLQAMQEGLKIGGSDDVKGYSGFSVRMALPEDIVFSGPHGDVEAEVTAVKSDGYIDMSGSIGANGKKGGIVILDNPENPGYPQAWILRNRNSMQNAAYPGNQLIPVSTNQFLVLKYSLVVYSGKMTNKKINKISGL